MVQIRDYVPTDESQWLRCRVLSFLDTAYFDNVLQHKEHYEHPAIELVAEVDGQIVGLIATSATTPPKSRPTASGCIPACCTSESFHNKFRRAFWHA